MDDSDDVPVGVGIGGANDSPMTVTYRLQGLDGEATEEMISSVDAAEVDEADPEETFAVTASLRRRDGLRALLALVPLSGCRSPQVPPAGDPLDASRAYLAELGAGRLDAALALAWSPRDRAARDAMEQSLRKTASHLAGGSLRIEAMEAKADGSWAVAVLRVVQSTPMGEARILRREMLVGRDGRWLVVPRSRLGDRDLVRLQDDSFERLAEWYRLSSEELEARWLREP